MVDSWFEVARSARKVANDLVRDHHRSCLNRAYYAVYSKVTLDLSGLQGVHFPANREGPNHPGESGRGGVRRIIESQKTLLDESRRQKLSELIGRLYTLRIIADYHPSIEVDAGAARAAVSIMNTIFESF